MIYAADFAASCFVSVFFLSINKVAQQSVADKITCIQAQSVKSQGISPEICLTLCDRLFPFVGLAENFEV